MMNRLELNLKHWAKVAILAIAYFLSAKFAFFLTQLGSSAQASVLYPPIGISLAGVLLLGRHTWIGVTLGAFWFAMSLSNVTLTVALGAALGNTLEMITTIALLDRVGFQPALKRIKDVIALVGFAAVGTSVNAIVSTLNGWIGSLFPLSDVVPHALTIWLGDLVSVLVLTPLLLIWLGHARHVSSNFSMVRWVKSLRTSGRGDLSSSYRPQEAGIWLTLLLICSICILLAPLNWLSPEVTHLMRPLLQYLPFLFIVWAALRLGQRGTVLSTFVVSLVAIWGVSQDISAYTLTGQTDGQRSLFHLQTFLGVMTIAALVLAAAIAERQAVEQQLRQQIQRDRLLADITKRVRESLDVQAVLDTTVEEVRRFLNADRAHLVVFDDEGYSNTVAESVVSGWRSTLNERSPFSVKAAIRQIYQETPIRVTCDVHQVDISQNQFLKLYYELYQIQASVSLPIYQNGDLYGALNIHQCSSVRQWHSADIDLLAQLATQVELALQQGRLYQQVQAFASDLEQQVQERTEQLQQNMEELRSAIEAKDTLLHAVTHDLRTPLIGMQMVLQRLQTKPDDQLRLSRSMLNRMLETNDQQLELIKSLLEESAESDPLVLHPEPVRLGEFIQNTIDAMEPQLKSNRAQVTVEVPDALSLSVDPMQLRRVFENLINNAVTHNPPGVQLTLQATPIESSDGKKLRCAIVDNGIGMTDEQCAVVFKKPYLRATHNRHRTGLGLGLFLCSQIITAHGGEIGIKKAPIGGAEFWFTVPMS